MKKFTKLQLKAWGRVAQDREFNRLESPAAPQPKEVAVYRTYLKKILKGKKGARVLVLGATPELRDLPLSMGCQVVAVDFNWDMIGTLSSVMKYKNHKNEIVVKGDWFSMPLEDNNFDVILADASLNNVVAKDYDRLLKIVKGFLKRNGYFLTRQMLVATTKEDKPKEEIIKQYKKVKATWIDLLLSLLLACSELTKWCNREAQEGSAQKFYEWTGVQSRKPGPARKEFKKMYSKFRIGTWSFVTKDRFESLLKKYFKIVELKSPAGLGWTPIYLLKRK